MKSPTKIMLLIGLSAMAAACGASLLVGGGMNLSSTSDSDTIAVNNSARSGFNGGFALEHAFTDHFSLLVGGSIETRGELETKTLTLTPTITNALEEEVNLSYLQIPVLFQGVLPMGPLALSAFAGPDMGILLNAKGNTHSITHSVTAAGADTVLLDTRDTVFLAKQMNMVDFGITAGIGIEYRLGAGALFFRPSYYYGLTDFRDTAEGSTNAGAKGIHRNIKLMLGFKFDLFRDNN